MRKFSILVVLLTGCAASTMPDGEGQPQLTFIHINDTYRVGAVEDGTRGGFGRVVTVLRRALDEGRDVRILHGGDFLYPSLESEIWHGEQMVEALNFVNDLAPLFLVAGNHEFDPRTPEHLIDAVRTSTFDWLADNYRFYTGAPDVDRALKSGFIYTHAGKRVGIFALTLHADDGGTARDYVAVDRDYVAAAKKAITRLEAAGADLIIGLTHLQLKTDKQIASLKAEHPKLAFITGGHEHEPQFLAGAEDRAVVMKGASNARLVWQIDVTFDAQGSAQVSGQRLALDASVDEDPVYAPIDKKWRSQLLERYPVIEARVGTAALSMDVTEETVRSRETSWGNFIADQMRTAFGHPPTDLAFLNSGSLRIDDFIADDIRYEDIARTFGFSSFLRVLPIAGEEFRELLEAGFRGDGSSQGYLPEISGFRVCVDRRRDEHERIVSLQLPTGDGWQEIDPQREYTLVIPDFIFEGGDGYAVPQRRKAQASPPASELKYLVLDAVVRAQAAGLTVGVPVDPKNPRLAFLDGDAISCWR